MNDNFFDNFNLNDTDTDTNTLNEGYYNQFIDTLYKIQANTAVLNEGADEKEGGGDEDGGGADDLDALLKDEGGDKGADAADDEGGGDDLGDLNLDDAGGEGGEEAPDDLDLEGGEDAEKDSFETDNEGLMDTITKLTKAGHTVKIIVSAEGKQTIESIDGKKITSMKQLNEMLMKKPVKGSMKMDNRQNKMLSALMEQMNALTKEVKNLKKNPVNATTAAVQPIQEEKYIKVRQSDYNALIEMAEDMNFKIDEQDAIIKNFEAMQEFNVLDEETDIEIDNILSELDESIAELNQNTARMKLRECQNNSYNRGIDTSLTIFTEDVMPFINNINIARANILAEMDIYETISKRKDNEYNNTSTISPDSKLGKVLNQLNESISDLNKLNVIDKFTTLVESHLPESNTYTKDDIMAAINEATGDICIANPDYEYDSSYPQYEYFSKRVSKLLNDAYSKSNNSIIANYADNDDLISRQNMKKFDLPFMSPEKWNATVTIKSAIVNLAEALVDIDGNLNLDLCKKAYLYHKTKNPQTMKDFAMPIAIYEQSDGQLYAHPTLIKNVANILKNDSCMKTYDIDSREKLYDLRESLVPYLEAIGETIPWQNK